MANFELSLWPGTPDPTEAELVEIHKIVREADGLKEHYYLAGSGGGLYLLKLLTDARRQGVGEASGDSQMEELGMQPVAGSGRGRGRGRGQGRGMGRGEGKGQREERSTVIDDR